VRRVDRKASDEHLRGRQGQKVVVAGLTTRAVMMDCIGAYWCLALEPQKIEIEVGIVEHLEGPAAPPPEGGGFGMRLKSPEGLTSAMQAAPIS